MSDAIKYPYHALIQQKFLLHHSEFKHLNTNLQFIVYLMFSVDAVLHGGSDPGDGALGIPVSDIGPGLIIASI